jgi:hypothetical protein
MNLSKSTQHGYHRQISDTRKFRLRLQIVRQFKVSSKIIAPDYQNTSCQGPSDSSTSEHICNVADHITNKRLEAWRANSSHEEGWLSAITGMTTIARKMKRRGNNPFRIMRNPIQR